MALPGPGDYVYPDKLNDKFSLLQRAKRSQSRTNLNIEIGSPHGDSRGAGDYAERENFLTGGSTLSDYSYTIQSNKPNPRK